MSSALTAATWLRGAMWSFPPESWALRFNSALRSDLLTDAAVELVARGGPADLTIRRIAQQADMSPAWVMDRFGSRAQVLAIVTDVFAERWLRWIGGRARSGVVALLPEREDDVLATRVWLSFVEFAHVEPAVTGPIKRVAEFERGLAESAELQALVDGLRRHLTHPVAPMAIGQAQEILTGALDRINPLPD